MGLSKLLLLVFVSVFFISIAQAKKDHEVNCNKQPHHKECLPVLHLDARRPDGLLNTNWKTNLLKWRDLSPSNLTGLLQGGYSSKLIPWIKKLKGQPASLSFNGINQYVNFGTTKKLQLTSAFAIEIWFKPFTAVNGDSIESQMLVNKEGAYELAIYGAQPNDNMVWFALANLQPGWSFSSVAAPIKTNQWHQLVWTYDMNVTSGNNLFVYHNGTVFYEEQGTGTIDRSNPGTATYYDDFRIGGRQLPKSNEYFHGEISIVKVYQRMLSKKEVSKHCRRHQRRFSIACETPSNQ